MVTFLCLPLQKKKIFFQKIFYKRVKGNLFCGAENEWQGQRVCADSLAPGATSGGGASQTKVHRYINKQTHTHTNAQTCMMITFRLVVCTKCKLFNFNTDYRQISDFLYHKNNNSFRYKQFHNKMRIASSNLKPSDPRSFLCILYNIVSCHRVEHFFLFLGLKQSKLGSSLGILADSKLSSRYGSGGLT